MPQDKSEPQKAAEGALLAVAETAIPPDSPDPAASLAAYREEVPELGKKVGLHAARTSLMQVPTGLTGKEAERWSDERLVEYLPAAVGELGYQLKYGSDKQRTDAARAVLDATGRGKKENAPTLTPTLVFMGQPNGGGFHVPWLPPSKQPGAVVDGNPPETPRLLPRYSTAANGPARPTAAGSGRIQPTVGTGKTDDVSGVQQARLNGIPLGRTERP